jgi:hypothetical protein
MQNYRAGLMVGTSATLVLDFHDKKDPLCVSSHPHIERWRIIWGVVFRAEVEGLSAVIGTGVEVYDPSEAVVGSIQPSVSDGDHK